ncbi:molybdopterin molybdotransferase MoeA [Thermodesulfobacteriota bacterium]
MKTFIGYTEALALTKSMVPLMKSEVLPLDRLTGEILAEDIVSKVDSPSVNCSLRDGYAIHASDLSGAAPKKPVHLKLAGSITAGKLSDLSVSHGQTVKITTGAPIPSGADAVIADEFCRKEGDEILCFRGMEPSRNVLRRGTDIGCGQTVVGQGERLSPPAIGLLASAGLDQALVYASPRVAVIATGDEIVAPGHPLPKGKLYASNLVEICSWLTLLGLPFELEVVPDRREDIKAAITRLQPHVDAYVTSGGAWGSERDLMINVLDELDWQGIYHRVRMGPGKAVGFGLLAENPFFCLPGGPPSNEVAFLQLALPGLMAMKGYRHPLFPVLSLSLTESVRGDQEWTQFIHARRVTQKGQIAVQPIRQGSRLRSMAEKEALIIIPEGCEGFVEGENVEIQILAPLP